MAFHHAEGHGAAATHNTAPRRAICLHISGMLPRADAHRGSRLRVRQFCKRDTSLDDSDVRRWVRLWTSNFAQEEGAPPLDVAFYSGDACLQAARWGRPAGPVHAGFL